MNDRNLANTMTNLVVGDILVPMGTSLVVSNVIRYLAPPNTNPIVKISVLVVATTITYYLTTQHLTPMAKKMVDDQFAIVRETLYLIKAARA